MGARAPEEESQWGGKENGWATECLAISAGGLPASACREARIWATSALESQVRLRLVMVMMMKAYH